MKNFEPSGADLTVYDYRWDWTTCTGAGINQGIIPLWLALSDSSRLEEVQKFIKIRAQQFSYAYQWLGLPLFYSDSINPVAVQWRRSSAALPCPNPFNIATTADRWNWITAPAYGIWDAATSPAMISSVLYYCN